MIGIVCVVNFLVMIMLKCVVIFFIIFVSSLLVFFGVMFRVRLWLVIICLVSLVDRWCIILVVKSWVR